MAYQEAENTHHKGLPWFTSLKHPPPHPFKRRGLEPSEWDGWNWCRESQPGSASRKKELENLGRPARPLWCSVCQVRRLELIVSLPSGKLINNSVWQKKKRKVPHPHPCSFTLLLSALASPQGSGADRWWKEIGSKGGLSLFLAPVLKLFKELE